MTITGTGTQPILHESFNPIPSQIYVNDVLQDYTGIYANNLEQEINYITIKWNEDIQIPSTHKMFYYRTNIVGIDIIDFMMPNLVNTQEMFEGCINLETLNFYNFDTSKVLDMTNMFALCSSLVSLNLNSFDISQVTTFWFSFFRCSNLLYLNLNNFALKSDAKLYNMFSEANPNLKLCYDNSKASLFSTQYTNMENKCDEICYQGNIYICYSDDKPCPVGYNYLIPGSKSCVINCHDDKIFKYKYNNECYK